MHHPFAAPAAAATWFFALNVPTSPRPRRLGRGPGGDLALRLLACDGATWLEATLRVIPSAATIARRQHPSADLLAGRVRVRAPLAPGRRRLSLRYDGCHLELHVDGVLADEEWPYGAVVPCRGAGAPGMRAVARAMSDRELAAWHRRPLRDPTATGPFAATYWRPPGHDTAVGDVMLTAADDGLHLLWLFDRHGHGAKWHAGAHQFRHAVSPDLKRWRHLPAALPIRRPWESFGTGAAVIDGNGAWHLAYQVHGERFAEGEGQAGVWMATSSDGREWLEHAARGPGAGDPTVYRAKDCWHLVASGRRHESADLRSWRLADDAFLPVMPMDSGGPTLECPCLWTWNGWTYALQGRTGFWLARDPLGPFWPGPDGSRTVAQPRWDIYDGLFVPMAAMWRGRCILAGWLRGDQPWGGVLVWRELLQEADGTLAMRWLPELTPSPRRWRPIIDGARLPDGSWRLALTCSGPLSLDLGCATLIVEPEQRRARWTSKPEGAPAEPIAYGREVAITAVEGLDRPYALEVIAWRDRDGWVLDACLGGRRTLICFRTARPVRLALAAGGASISGMRLGELRPSP